MIDYDFLKYCSLNQTMMIFHISVKYNFNRPWYISMKILFFEFNNDNFHIICKYNESTKVQSLGAFVNKQTPNCCACSV